MQKQGNCIGRQCAIHIILQTLHIINRNALHFAQLFIGCYAPWRKIIAWNKVRNWDFNISANATAPTIYQAWFDSLEKQIWADELTSINKTFEWPEEQTLVENLKRDSAFVFVDNMNTSDTETLKQQVTAAFKVAAAGLAKEEAVNGLVWWKHKDSYILHLLRESLLPFGRTHIQAGGWSTVLNAHTKTHGPSWRMVVHLTADIEAYGIYPGGQSGNPGSKFYDNAVDDWAAGRYYTLWMMKENEASDKRVIGKLTLLPYSNVSVLGCKHKILSGSSHMFHGFLVIIMIFCSIQFYPNQQLV